MAGCVRTGCHPGGTVLQGARTRGGQRSTSKTRAQSPSWFPQSLHVPLPPRCPSVSCSWPHSGLLGIPLLPWQPQHTHGSSSPWQQQRDEISRGLLSASPRTDVRIRVQVLSQSRLSPLQCPFYLNWVGLQGLHDQRDSQCSSASLATQQSSNPEGATQGAACVGCCCCSPATCAARTLPASSLAAAERVTASDVSVRDQRQAAASLCLPPPRRGRH